MHKDQTRLKDVFLAQLTGRIVEETPEAERDCTVMNRLFIQGPDPLFLMETAPDLFAALCSVVGVTVEDGRKAIETAHWMGPASLFDGDLGISDSGVPSMDGLTPAHRNEVLWLVLASCSDCTEEGYSKATMLDRIQRATKATLAMQRLTVMHPEHLMDSALESLSYFQEETAFTPDPLFGKPMATEDHAFYVGYKAGHECVAVQSGGLTFYGTPPTTTLEEQGVTVDKVLSPFFGIVFPKG